MKIRVEELKHYVGSKGGAGVYQRIINKVPDKRKILIPFVGSGQIFKRLDHTRCSIYINDYDRSVSDLWITNTQYPIVVSNYVGHKEEINYKSTK